MFSDKHKLTLFIQAQNTHIYDMTNVSPLTRWLQGNKPASEKSSQFISAALIRIHSRFAIESTNDS